MAGLCRNLRSRGKAGLRKEPGRKGWRRVSRGKKWVSCVILMTILELYIIFIYNIYL